VDEAKIEAIKSWPILATHTTSEFSWPYEILSAFHERF
jgi:hypothetical protein